MNLYDVEDEPPHHGKKDKQLPQHAFEFNREIRRMVCSKCGGKMNECPAVCPGKGAAF